MLPYDETKTVEMVSILQDYHQYVPDIDGQPFKLPIWADGLSVERAHAAHESRINAPNPLERLEGLSPFAQEWHKRQLLLQVRYRYTNLYKGNPIPPNFR